MDKKTEVIVLYTHAIAKAIRVHELPKPGETMFAIGYSGGIDGGKGTDVAVACGRLEVPCALIAKLAENPHAKEGHEILKAANVDDRYVLFEKEEDHIPGVVLIDDHGNNMIVISHSKVKLTEEEMREALDHYSDAKYLVTGYELAADCVETALSIAKEKDLITIVNPSPVPETIPSCWEKIDILVLNEVELQTILKNENALDDPETSLKELKEITGVKNVVLTLGAQGYMCFTDRICKEDGIKVEKVIDTSGAGDGFIGAMVARLSKGDSLSEACSYANKYSSITVQREGTVTCYPTLKEVEEIIG